MKSLITTTVLLALLLTGIFLNHWYVNHVADAASGMVAALPDVDDKAAPAKVAELMRYWEARASIIGLSVSFPTIDRINEQIAILIAYAESKDSCGYQITLALLSDAISDMRRLETFSIGNFF